MKKALLPVLFLLILSCSSDDSSTCKLTSASLRALYFDEIWGSSLVPGSSEKIYFEYSNNQLSAIHGGYIHAFGPGSQLQFRDDVVNNVTHSGDTIFVENHTGLTPQPDMTAMIVLEDKIKYRKTKKTGSFTITKEYFYEYSGNTVTEKCNGFTTAVYHIQNGNLERVEKFEIDYNTGEAFAKKEILFSDFSANTNLLKGKFYINGAFYTAFSKGNFSDVAVYNCTLVNGNFVRDGLSESHLWFTFPDDVANYLFETDCN